MHHARVLSRSPASAVAQSFCGHVWLRRTQLFLSSSRKRIVPSTMSSKSSLPSRCQFTWSWRNHSNLHRNSSRSALHGSEYGTRPELQFSKSCFAMVKLARTSEWPGTAPVSLAPSPSSSSQPSLCFASSSPCARACSPGSRQVNGW